jgi:DHA2 family methylenomycin A resistance protein-like MFS transporter
MLPFGRHFGRDRSIAGTQRGKAVAMDDIVTKPKLDPRKRHFAIPGAAPPVATDRRFVLAITATCLAFLLVQLDVTIVNVALATMGSELHATISGLQWVVDAYAIAFASLLLSAGAFGDRIGSRRVLAAGFAIFIAASAACGFAPNSAVLIAARIAQGAGAALMVPSSLALLNHACGNDQKLRGHAVAWWTAAGSVGLAAGPIAGGLLIHWLGWRSIFFVNLPLGVLGIWLTLSFVEETRIGNQRKEFDMPGQMLGIVTLAALTGAVIEAGQGGILALPVLVLILLATAGGVGFILAESRSAHPMLPLRLFGNRQFSSTILVGLVINFTLYGFLFVLSLYLQRARGYTPEQTGLAFLPLSVAVGFANVFAGWLMTKTGPRPPMMWGLIGGALGFALLTGINAQTAYVMLLPSFLLISCGVGTAVPAMTTALLSTVEKTQSGVASGALNTIRQASGAIGVAVFGVIGGHSEQSVAGLHATFWIGALLLIGGAAMAAIGTKSER